MSLNNQAGNSQPAIVKQAEIINRAHGFPATLQFEGRGVGACLVQRWQGYLDEYDVPSLVYPMIAIIAGGRAKIRRQRSGHVLSIDYAMPGDITLIPREQQMRWHVKGDMDVIALTFSDHRTCDRIQGLYDRIAQQFGSGDYVGSFTNSYIYTCCSHISQVLISAAEVDTHYIDAQFKALELYIQAFLGEADDVPQTREQLHSHCVTFTMQRLTHSLANRLRIEDIARELRVSPAYLTKRFKQELGITPHHFLLLKRIKRAQDLLVNTTFSIAEIADESGFSHQSHLTRNFSKVVGVSPLKFRQRAHTNAADLT